MKYQVCNTVHGFRRAPPELNVGKLVDAVPDDLQRTVKFNAGFRAYCAVQPIGRCHHAAFSSDSVK